MYKEYVSSLVSQDTIDTSSKTIQQLHDPYSTLQRRLQHGSGENRSKVHSKNYAIECATNQYCDNQTSINDSMCKRMLRLTAWEPYSHRREKSLQKHPIFFLLHITWLPSWRRKGTTTSMKGNFWQLSKLCSTGDNTLSGHRNHSLSRLTMPIFYIGNHLGNSIDGQLGGMQNYKTTTFKSYIYPAKVMFWLTCCRDHQE